MFFCEEKREQNPLQIHAIIETYETEQCLSSRHVAGWEFQEACLKLKGKLSEATILGLGMALCCNTLHYNT